MTEFEQIMMLAEESSELSTATLHLLRKAKEETSFKSFVEEFADVELMMDEMYYCFRERNLRGRVYEAKEMKIQRLKKRLCDE